MAKHGVCEDMCPQKEIAFRVRERLLHELEKKSNGQPDVLVKEYRRSAAGRETPDVRNLRTIGALVKTTDYLTNEVCSTDRDWALIYEFVFDRLRAVRQDLVMQSLSDKNAVYILEHCVRFYLISIDKLKRRPPSEFDVQINETHTQETLKQLLVFYDTTLPADVSSKTTHTYQNRSEYESIYLLFNMRHYEALQHFLTLPSKLRLTELCKTAWQLNLAAYQHNYVRVFRLIEQLTEIQRCALHRHTHRLEREMLRLMNTAYSSKATRFPLPHLCSLIGQKSEPDMTSSLVLHGINVVDGCVKFSKSSWKE